MTTGAGGGSARVLSPAPRDAWASVLKASAEATIFHTPEWLEACCVAGGFEDASRLYERQDGRQIVIPMVRHRGRRALRTTWSMPDGWGSGGAIAPRRVTPEDVATVLDDLLRATGRLIVKPGHLSGGAWVATSARKRVPRTVHLVDLREGFGALWSNEFSSNTRTKIRKAEKRGVDFQWGTGNELVKIHWDIYLRWTAHRATARGIPVPVGVALAKRHGSAERFETVARCLGERCRVAIAWIDGQAVASAIVLHHGAHAHYWRSASDLAVDRSRHANWLILARILEDAAERGCDHLDMGESGGVRSLVDFKEHFGARPQSYDELRFEPQIVTNATRGRDRLLRVASDVTLGGFARFKRWRDRTIGGPA
jgi:Acetyltransferase (GNAT) domain